MNDTETFDNYYSESIRLLAEQVFIVPYKAELEGESPDLYEVMQDITETIFAICDTFGKTEQQVSEDVNDMISGLPLEEFEESLKARKEGKLH